MTFNLLSFFKKIFGFNKKQSKQEIKPLKTLEIYEIKHFLKNLSDEKEQSLIGEFNNTFLDIKTKLKELSDYLGNFEEVQIPSNLGEEEKQKLLKSRENYTSKIRAILIDLSQRIDNFEKAPQQQKEISEEKSLENKTSQDLITVRQVNSRIYIPFKTAIDLLSKNLTYDKMLLNNFFSSDLNEIDKQINELKDLFEQINQKYQINIEYFKKIDDTLKDLNKFERDRSLKVKRKQEIPKIIEKYNSAKKMKERITKRDEELKLLYPEKYKTYDEIRKQIDSHEKELKELSSAIILSLIPLQNELDEFSDIYKVKKPLINGYLTNPLENFINDESLEIIQLLNKLASLIDNGTIKISEEKLDEKIQQINEAIKKIGELNREEIKQKVDDLNLKIKQEKSKLRNNKSLNEIDDNYYKITHAESQFKHINKYVEELKSELNKLKLIEEIKEIEKKINNYFDENIEIKIDEDLEKDDKSPFVSQIQENTQQKNI